MAGALAPPAWEECNPASTITPTAPSDNSNLINILGFMVLFFLFIYLLYLAYTDRPVIIFEVNIPDPGIHYTCNPHLFLEPDDQNHKPSRHGGAKKGKLLDANDAADVNHGG